MSAWAALMRAFEESAPTNSAVDSNVRRETQFPGSATVSRKIGGIKRELRQKTATTDAIVAGMRPQRRAISTTSNSSSEPAVDRLKRIANATPAAPTTRTALKSPIQIRIVLGPTLRRRVDPYTF